MDLDLSGVRLDWTGCSTAAIRIGLDRTLV
jgi:hypothetical protein